VRRARARGTHNHRDETDRRVVEGETRVTKIERLGNFSDTQHVQSAKGRELVVMRIKRQKTTESYQSIISGPNENFEVK